ncbi:hypothetical protein [Virgisporangium aurantiacum]|nr:hypothetical protein [Virgisporangium aurantiacum]
MVTYSVWLKVHPDDLGQARAAWETSAYAELRLHGVIANAVLPWPEVFDEPARAEVRDTGSLPYLIGAEGTVLSRVLSQQWDRDDVLGCNRDPLPVSIRQPVTAEWSVERTVGLALRVSDGLMIFAGPGRTVHLEPFNTPTAASAEDVIATMIEGAPPPDGELFERDGPLFRRAFWLAATVNGRPQHEFYGHVAAPGAVLAVTCMYDDRQDARWATNVWRSARCHQPSS